MRCFLKRLDFNILVVLRDLFLLLITFSSWIHFHLTIYYESFSFCFLNLRVSYKTWASRRSFKIHMLFLLFHATNVSFHVPVFVPPMLIRSLGVPGCIPPYYWYAATTECTYFSSSCPLLPAFCHCTPSLYCIRTNFSRVSLWSFFHHRCHSVGCASQTMQVRSRTFPFLLSSMDLLPLMVITLCRTPIWQSFIIDVVVKKDARFSVSTYAEDNARCSTDCLEELVNEIIPGAAICNCWWMRSNPFLGSG